MEYTPVYHSSGIASTPKPWGKSIRRLLMDSVQVEEIHVETGGYSSIHHHVHKVNMFVCLSGRLLVHLFDHNTTKPWKTITLEQGEHYVVPEGRPHQFFCDLACHALEFYWQANPADQIRIEPEDIIRHTKNGLKDGHGGEPAIPRRISLRYCARCNGIVESPRRHVWQGAERDFCYDCFQIIN